ncbi:MAG: MerR family transcriptional regulator [Alphaproteobacteria bacterium]|nr:MerR family transcriptional regulator [Alphaproteobacteria bacterium]
MLKAENAYRTITEVADLLQVPASVLRFWETQFHQIKPIKRMGRRYYQAEDVVLLARIRDYLYKEGFTIKGVQKRLKMPETKNADTSLNKVSTETALGVDVDKVCSDLEELKIYLSEYI